VDTFGGWISKKRAFGTGPLGGKCKNPELYGDPDIPRSRYPAFGITRKTQEKILWFFGFGHHPPTPPDTTHPPPPHNPPPPPPQQPCVWVWVCCWGAKFVVPSTPKDVGELSGVNPLKVISPPWHLVSSFSSREVGEKGLGSVRHPG